MLTCNEFLAELNEYLDATQEIDVELRKKLESHINACPNCWVVCDTTKKTIQVYKGMKAQVIPPEVHARLIRALEKKMAARQEKTPESKAGA